MVMGRTNQIHPMEIHSESERECAICLDKEGEWRTLVCNHHYHVVCIDKWMRVSERCPMCMRNIPEMEMEEQHHTAIRRYLLVMCATIAVIILMVIYSSRS